MTPSMSGEESGIELFSRSRLARGPVLQVGDREYPTRDIIAAIGPQLTDERRARLAEVVANRTFNVIPVLENLYDLGNVSAVMRSQEAFGFLETNLVVPPGSRFKAANRVARGADKWLDIQIHRSVGECVADLKKRGFKVYATSLESSAPISELDFSKPTAIVLGNEKEGVSREMLKAVDGRFRIPMLGFTQSFNISVAAAICFYHIVRDREARLGQNGDLSDAQKENLLANYYLRCLDNPEAILRRKG
jgi:tRNA (guanosine-2'-O-)-methyltransferase